MRLFAVIAVMQIIIAGLVLHTSVNSSSAKIARSSIKQVLGTSLIADDSVPTDTPADQPTDTSVPDQQTTSNPTNTPVSDQVTPPQVTDQPTTDQSVTAPTDTPIPSSSDISNIIPTDTPMPSLPADETGLTNSSDTSVPAPSGEMTPTSASSDTPTIETVNTVTPTPENQDASVVDTVNLTDNTAPVDSAIVNPDTAVSNLSDIGNQTIQQAQQQDSEISASQPPQQQTQMLLQSAKENVITINDVVQQNAYATESFLAQRVTDEISKAIATSQNAPSAKTLSDVQLFCKQADLSLRTEQLLVPQDLEQDIEIARGLCNSIK